MGVTGAPAPKRPGPVGRFLGRLLGLLPGPPDKSDAGDPLIAGLDSLPPDERQARLQAWRGKFRWGRGDGGG
jgi:hypothetical protein